MHFRLPQSGCPRSVPDGHLSASLRPENVLLFARRDPSDGGAAGGIRPFVERQAESAFRSRQGLRGSKGLCEVLRQLPERQRSETACAWPQFPPDRHAANEFRGALYKIVLQ